MRLYSAVSIEFTIIDKSHKLDKIPPLHPSKPIHLICFFLATLTALITFRLPLVDIANSNIALFQPHNLLKRYYQIPSHSFLLLKYIS